MSVAITGMGAICALGASPEQLFERLCAGASGLHPDPLAKGPTARLPRVYASSDMAVFAARSALGDYPNPAELGLVGASTSGDMSVAERAWKAWRAGEEPESPKHFIWRQLAHVPTQRVAWELGIEGSRSTVSTACTSGTVAISNAVDLIESGSCPAALAFGADALCSITREGFGCLGVYSPERTRPFDENRQGMNLGEGAGALLLEDLDHARARGANVLAVVHGSGNASDAHHLTAPHPEARGAIAAIEQALGGESVDYVNAHATGTLKNDEMEALALASLGAAVSGIKGAIGHCLGAAGTLEAVVAVMALQRGIAPPNTGLVSSAFDLDLVRTPRQMKIRTVLSVNFAFGGHNAALALRAP